jgi:hypothetical protein
MARLEGAPFRNKIASGTVQAGMVETKNNTA